MRLVGVLGLLACLFSACVMGDGYDDFGFAAAGESYTAAQDIPKDPLLAFAGIYQNQQGEAYLLLPRRSSAVQQQPKTSLAIHQLPNFNQAAATPSILDDATKPFLSIQALEDGAGRISLSYGDATVPVVKELARVTQMPANTVYADLQLLASSAAKVVYARQVPVEMSVSIANFDLTKAAQIAGAMKVCADNAQKLNELNVTSVNASTNPDQTGGKFLVPGAAGATLYINAASSPTAFMGVVTPANPGTPPQQTVPTPRVPGPQPQGPQQQGNVTNDDDGCSSGGANGAFLGIALAMLAVTTRRKRLFA